MHALAGTHYFEIGGQRRPARFNTTNQAAEFCEIRGIGYKEYAELMTESGLQQPSVIRDLIYSALFDGAIFEGKPVDFNKYNVGVWIDQVADKEQFMTDVGKAIGGTANPNEKAQENQTEAA